MSIVTDRVRIFFSIKRKEGLPFDAFKAQVIEYYRKDLEANAAVKGQLKSVELTFIDHNVAATFPGGRADEPIDAIIQMDTSSYKAFADLVADQQDVLKQREAEFAAFGDVTKSVVLPGDIVKLA